MSWSKLEANVMQTITVEAGHKVDKFFKTIFAGKNVYHFINNVFSLKLLFVFQISRDQISAAHPSAHAHTQH